jgi:broad specificity phosphatase PhoE
MMRWWLLPCVLFLFTVSTARAESAVFVVRHAERADAGTPDAKMMGADPSLSSVGLSRAKSLAAVLKDARITAVFTTEYKRSRQTAGPLAKNAGLEVTAIPSKNMQALIDAVRNAKGNVLVVGHSNTIPELLKALGISEAVQIGENDYDDLLIVARGSAPTLIRLHH